MKFLLPALMLLAGCSYDRNGVTHHVIIGFGIVSVPKTNSVADVISVKALGLHYGYGLGREATVGYVNETVTRIKATATNTVIEVKR